MIQLSAHIGYLFTELPLDQRVAAAGAAGFDAVEHPQPFDIPARRMRNLLDASGLSFTQIGVATAVKGLACLPDRRQDFRDHLARSIDYAAEIGCSLIHPMAGVVPPGSDRDTLWATYDDNMHHAIEAATRHGMSAIVEPISAAGMPGFLIDTARLGLQVIDRLGADRAGLLLDSFHCWAGGEDFEALLAGHIGSIRHIHAAGFPGRHEPDSGDHGFGFLLPLLTRLSYHGAVGFEYVPAGKTLAGLGWLADWRATRDALASQHT